MPPDPTGAQEHYRALERLYASAPVNDLFQSHLEITGQGLSKLTFMITEKVYHAAGAAHGTIYFKMLDDAAFYAANTLATDTFLLTTSFNLHFTKPVKEGVVVAEGRWISGKRRVMVAESRLVDCEGEEIGRGRVYPRQHMALDPGTGQGKIEGIATTDPVVMNL